MQNDQMDSTASSREPAAATDRVGSLPRTEAQCLEDATLGGVAAIFESRPLGAFQLRVLLFCLAAGLFEGFDNQAIGFTGPALREHLSIPLTSFGTILAASQVGVVLGALTLAPLADRVGRKWLMSVCLLIIGLISLQTVAVASFTQLLINRLLVGFGCGGVLAVFPVLAAEYSPPRLRAMVVSTLVVSVPTGGVLAALVSSLLIDRMGWQIIYLIGGSVTLALSVVSAIFLPESLSFLLSRGAPRHRTDRLFARIWPDLPIPKASETVESSAAKGISLTGLFTAPHGRLTTVLCIAAFGNYLVVLMITSWSTSLLKAAGMTTSSATAIAMVNNLGGLIGTVTIGRLFSMVSPRLLLSFYYIAGAAATVLMARCAPDFITTAVFAGVSGVLLGGSIAGLTAIAAVSYPTLIRGTGVGSMIGVGRIGAICGTLLPGVFLAMHWSVTAVYAACVMPALVAAVVVVFLQSGVRRA